MPIFEVFHSIPLSDAQRQKIAEGITHLHSRKFVTPSLFVNVTFTDSSSHSTYVGGKPKTYNKVVVSVRPGGTRTTEQFEELCEEVIQIWDDVVNDGKKGSGNKEMRVVFIQAVLSAAVEAGFRLPQASQDRYWLKDNKAQFQRLADAGDMDFQEVMRELDTRDDFVSARF